MDIQKINEAMQGYVDNGEMAGAALIIRKNDEVILDAKWGFADIEKKIPIKDNTIYRVASMTKCITAVAIMKLMEMGKIKIDDPLSKYLPEFANMRVVEDKRYEFHEGMSMLSLLPKLLFFNMKKVKSVPAKREITIRDLLSHASGLQQGVAGMMAMMKHNVNDTLEKRIKEYSSYALDFQPGEATGYSPCAAFDILGYLVGKLMDMPIDLAYKTLIFDPLGMTDATFKPNREQRGRLARVYNRNNGRLIDVTGTSKDLEGIIRIKPDSDYVAGCGGLYCTLSDYDKFGRMLARGGDGFLRPESVELMHTEAQKKHLEAEPGQVWGLGVRIRQNDGVCTEGTYGWSGAPGTHFFISPKDNIQVVFATQRMDLGGSGSYISRKIEELVFS